MLKMNGKQALNPFVVFIRTHQCLIKYQYTKLYRVGLIRVHAIPIQVTWSNAFFVSCSYMNGAATNPSAHVVAFAGAQVKKGLEIAVKLGAENFGE